MSYSVTNAKQDLIGALHGTTLDQITDVDGLFNRTARQLLLDVDPQETKRIAQFANPIYNSVYDYACPADLKGNRVIDIRPQVNRYPNDNWGQQYNKAFDITKSLAGGDSFTINFNSASKTIRVNSPSLTSGITLNECDSTSGNGAWTAGGDASGLTADTVNFAAGGGSLRFNLATGGTTGYLENSTMSQVDLTDELSEATLFAYVYLPDGSDFTSVSLRWGSDSANYYTSTATTTFTGTVFQDGWNLISFPWSSATTVGTPDYTKINYLKATFIYNGDSQTACRLDNVVVRMGTILEIEYYSKYLFRNAVSGAFQETVVDDSDLLNLDTESYNLFTNLLAYFAVQMQQGIDAMKMDSNYFLQQYQLCLKRYQALYKSEVSPPQSVYYGRKTPGYTKYVRRFYR